MLDSTRIRLCLHVALKRAWWLSKSSAVSRYLAYCMLLPVTESISLAIKFCIFLFKKKIKKVLKIFVLSEHSATNEGEL